MTFWKALMAMAYFRKLSSTQFRGDFPHMAFGFTTWLLCACPPSSRAIMWGRKRGLCAGNQISVTTLNSSGNMTTAKCPKLQLKIKKMNSQLADLYLALATTFLIKFKALKLILASTEQILNKCLPLTIKENFLPPSTPNIQRFLEFLAIAIL